MYQQALPKDFLTIEEAVALIKSDTRADAKVDTALLARNLIWLEEKHNFTIPLMKTVPGKSKPVKIGSKYVQVLTSYDKEVLRHAITEHYRETAGHDFIPNNTRALSTVADEEQSGGAVRPRRTKSIAKEGQIINGGETIKTNGADL